MRKIAGIPSDSDSENSSLEDEEVAVAGMDARKAQRPRINDTDALQEALEEIAWPTEASWDEAQAVTADEPTTVADVDDDLERELAFYNQALGVARVAIAKMEAAGVAWQRPPDYYAEMVKSDDHMLKVREQLAFEQKTIEEAGQRRKQREAKKYGKQVMAEVRKERAASKRANVDSMTKLRKQREKSGYEGELDVDAVLEGRQGGAGGRGAGGRDGGRGRGRGRDGGRGAGRGGRGPNPKRLSKDSKYGFGGPKRAGKRNDSASAANMDDFKQSRPQGRGRGGGRGGGGRGRGDGGGAPSPGGVHSGRVKKSSSTPNRPGKARREASRNK